MLKMGLFIQIFRFRQQKAAEKLFTALLCSALLCSAVSVRVRRSHVKVFFMCSTPFLTIRPDYSTIFLKVQRFT